MPVSVHRRGHCARAGWGPSWRRWHRASLEGGGGQPGEGCPRRKRPEYGGRGDAGCGVGHLLGAGLEVTEGPGSRRKG